MSEPPSLRSRFAAELAGSAPLSVGSRAYFGQRLRNRAFALVLERFQEAQKEGLTKAELARRIGKRPEVVGRLLASPGNWTLETVSELLLGISGEEVVLSAREIVIADAETERDLDSLPLG